MIDAGAETDQSTFCALISILLSFFSVIISHQELLSLIDKIY